MRGALQRLAEEIGELSGRAWLLAEGTRGPIADTLRMTAALLAEADEVVTRGYLTLPDDGTCPERATLEREARRRAGASTRRRIHQAEQMAAKLRRRLVIVRRERDEARQRLARQSSVTVAAA